MKFFMENNNQRVLIFVTIATILILVIIFAGVTYAFFSANNPEGSTAEIKSETGRMLITYNDGTDNIVPVTNIQPSNKILVNKTFTLTGSNTTVGMKTDDGLSMPYKVGVQYTSTFSDGMMHYYIKEVNRPTDSNVIANYVIKPETGKTEDDYKNQTVPGNDTYTGYTHGTFKNGKKYTEMVTGEFPALKTDQTITFNLKFQFPDNGENQDSEKGKSINAAVVVNYDFSVTNYIADLYSTRDKDANGITIDGLQKDGTGEFNMSLLSNKNKSYNVSLLDNTLADIEFDSYDNIRYTGLKPNNYITFNNETWRIIGVFNVYNVETNKYERLIKIVRGSSLGNYSWDTSKSSINSGYGINEWSQADLMNELNNDYLGTNTGTTTWFNGQNEQQTGSYDYSKNIKDEYVDKIATVRWNLGGLSNPTKPASSLYVEERGTSHVSTITDDTERTDFYSDKIGLMYPSDYGYASSNAACRNTTSIVSNCRVNNWLYAFGLYWTLSSLTTDGYTALSVYSTPQNLQYTFHSDNTSTACAVYPTLYLKQSVKITGGTGTSTNPYIID